jgi:hypothetical protein
MLLGGKEMVECLELEGLVWIWCGRDAFEMTWMARACVWESLTMEANCEASFSNFAIDYLLFFPYQRGSGWCSNT